MYPDNINSNADMISIPDSVKISEIPVLNLAFFGDARHALADGFIGWARLGLVDAIDATLQYVVCPCVASIDGALFAFGNATHFAGIIATVGAIGRLPARQGADFEFSVFARRFAQRAHASDECANALVAT